jgi:hypothetical protein
MHVQVLRRLPLGLQVNVSPGMLLNGMSQPVATICPVRTFVEPVYCNC